MSFFRKYSESYEGGRCAYGYEFVESYTDRNGVYHKSYCRRIKRTWHDPEDGESKLRKKSEDDSMRRAQKIIEKSDKNPEPSGFFPEEVVWRSDIITGL